MQALYEPKGRALEYSPLAVNLYRGCSHGCTYCYAPAATHVDRERFGQPSPRVGILEALERDCQRITDKQPVLLSFSSDPYQPIEAEHKLTRRAIEILHRHGFPVTILTKGGALAQRDFDLLGRNEGITGQPDKFGVTLTTLDATDATEWECRAAPPYERVDNLIAAKRLGISTWVSLEPVLNPENVDEIIMYTYPFVDEYKVGTWNHDARAKAIDWHKFAHDVKNLLDRLGKRYVLKNDLRRYL